MKWIFHGDDGREIMAARRHRMVLEQLQSRDITDERVLRAMEQVPREMFVPEDLQDSAYADGPLPIGQGQTISQPYVVAAMSQALQLDAGKRVLEIGTGSGYQTAVLAEMGLIVYSMEYLPVLARKAQDLLESLGYDSIQFRCGDGNLGWPEEAPFDGIIATAAPARLPRAMADQLATKANLVIPVGVFEQDLRVYTRQEDGSLTTRSLFPVRFVPLVSG